MVGGVHESDVVSVLDAAPEGRALRYAAAGSRRGALYKKKLNKKGRCEEGIEIHPKGGVWRVWGLGMGGTA